MVTTDPPRIHYGPARNPDSARMSGVDRVSDREREVLTALRKG